MLEIRKKTWEILKEATVGTKSNPKIVKIVVEGKQISDPSCIAEEFNKFFTSVGSSISNSVRFTLLVLCLNTWNWILLAPINSVKLLNLSNPNPAVTLMV
jgi:hypothetical protein